MMPDFNKSLGTCAISLAGGLPCDPELLKYHARVTEESDMPNLQMYARAAMGFIERETNRAFLQQTYTESFKDICGHSLRLSRYPAISIVEVKYLDTNLEWQTLDSTDYTLSSRCVVPSIFSLNSDKSWPSMGNGEERLRITYTAGYATMDSIPQEQIQALLFLMTHFNETRTPVNIGNITTMIEMSGRYAIDLLKIYVV